MRHLSLLALSLLLVAACDATPTPAADGGADDDVDPAEFGLQLAGKRCAQALRRRRVREDQRLLQENRAAPAGRQDEVALQQSADSSEFVEDVLGVHWVALAVSQAWLNGS